MPGWWMWVMAMGIALASGEPYYESPPFARRGEAEGIAREALSSGVEAKVERVYVDELGWRWVVRAPATTISEALAPSLGLTRREEAVAARDPGAATALLARVRRAHGGISGLPGGPVVVFRFTRELPVADITASVLHATRGDEVFADVDVQRGPGVSFRAGVVEGRPWSSVTPDAPLQADVVREQLQRVAVERVLGVAVPLARGELPDAAWERGQVPHSAGAGAPALRIDGDRASPPVSLWLDSRDRVERACFGDGDAATCWTYDGYRDVGGGASLPTGVEVRVGKDVVARVRDVSWEVLDAAPKDWFTLP